ncbi:thioredoxin-related transmembrane protein 2 homolog [Condylostylus longicornis]|uniref:thioredoxin-related transmembrane protein 2 homolog n=1 Tax=Condylostylus longicornis TaxID=2530218 RepID=UPI00244DB77B|nr:thioredoxin-related transmembrane protein 2 homolog [Condylostylus longicornis]
MTLKKDLKLLVKPYYWINILLSLSYVIAKRTPILCNYVFYHKNEERCELDGRETEILFFLLIVIMIRSRKTGSVTLISYLTSSFIYTKIANLILWTYGDFRFGIGFLILFVLLGLLFPEPTYTGPEHVTYFRSADALEEELKRDKKNIWLICFYTVWNPACVNFAPIFASLSAEYHLNTLRFGKIDIGRFPEAGKKFHVSDNSLSRQLPTIILFKYGKEVDRRPFADSKGKLQKFFFSEDNVKAAFELNNLYTESKSHHSSTKAIAKHTKTE